MLRRKAQPHQLRQYGLLVAIELEDGIVTPEQVSYAMQDAVRFMDGVGACVVDELGIIDEVTEGTPSESNPV